MKTCVKCKCTKDKSDFHKDQRRPDGLFPYCKKCRVKPKKERKKSYRINHSNGYTMVRCESHPLAQVNGFVYEHRKVFYDNNHMKDLSCEFCGADWSFRPYYDHVDHIDENKKNNDLSNLRALCNSCNVSRTKVDRATYKNAKPITYKGESLTAADWARRDFVKVEHFTIRQRLKDGWSVHDALTKPSRKKPKVKPIA